MSKKTSDRRTSIIELIASDGRMSVDYLAQAFGVSPETIRRDLGNLDARGLVRKVHGGALPPLLHSEGTFSERMVEDPKAKQIIAKKNNYCCPKIIDKSSIEIKGGRHPVIEMQLDPGNPYISNDLSLDRENNQIIMITGPNMSGKSAILRQTALICLLNQIGSFVPATTASLGVFDKIFTRVGASDNISMGASTFMVEMNETASILNNISEKSLVLLDEIGRGTSTYDGISIAWAITEYLHEHPYRPKVLFATHYHELNEMKEFFERVKNYNVSVKELKNKILFLRKLIPGGSAHSFGIQVAKMAGIPRHVIQSANNKLKNLENIHGSSNKKIDTSKKDEKLQLSFFKLDDPVLEELRDEINSLDIDTLTPVEALLQLNEIKRKLKKRN